MLTAGKGWVLAMLAMLSPKPGLRVAARGSGPGAKQRRPCPPLRAVAARRRRDEGRPAASTLRGPAGPASNKGPTESLGRSPRAISALWAWCGEALACKPSGRLLAACTRELAMESCRKVLQGMAHPPKPPAAEWEGRNGDEFTQAKVQGGGGADGDVEHGKVLLTSAKEGSTGVWETIASRPCEWLRDFECDSELRQFTAER